tara:strand:- start:1433 stop:1774 length:342 start_codon:yes stop_codon:yes gene_type:complete
MSFQNILIKQKKYMTTFRKLSLGAWKHPVDPTGYAKISLEFNEVNRFIIQYNKTNHCKVTINHVVGKMMGVIFDQYPEINVTLIRKSLYVRKHNSVFFQTFFKSGLDPDLLGD